MTEVVNTTEVYRQISLEYADTPPSMNTNVGKGHWRNFRDEKKRWEGIFCGRLMQARPPKGALHVKASATLRFPSRRKRDEGNFRTIIEKAVGDALQLMGVIEDDGPEFFEFERVVFEEECGPARTVVNLIVLIERASS